MPGNPPRKAENLIHEAMERLMDGRTVFLIAHRLRSATSADLIVLLDQGKVIEIGTHAELLRRGQTYAHLFNEQARGLALQPLVPLPQQDEIRTRTPRTLESDQFRDLA